MTWPEDQSEIGDEILEEFGEIVDFASVSTLSRNTTTGVRTRLEGGLKVDKAHVSPERTEFVNDAMQRVVDVKVRASDLASYTPKRDDTITRQDGRKYRIKAIELVLGQQFYALECYKVG